MRLDFVLAPLARIRLLRICKMEKMGTNMIWRLVIKMVFDRQNLKRSKGTLRNLPLFRRGRILCRASKVGD